MKTEQLANDKHETSIRGYDIEVIEGPDEGTRWESKGERCSIGVHPSCDFILSDPAVSRFHCEIVSSEYRLRVRDLGSSNGTTVDGVEIHDAYARHDSVVRLGRTSLHVRYLRMPTRIRLSERTVFGRLVGSSIAMRRMFALLERVAKSDVTLLLQGETGTGKSEAARSVHMESARCDGPFVMLDCGSLPATLLESEIFGHEKGAFTGAHTRRLGAFEEASKGTIFLDEIGEVPLELQAKLLSVLENRAIRRLGGKGSHAVDVRIIAATNRDLRSQVNEGRFREDLYYRLAVATIDVPPLRQRLEDIPKLVDHLLERLNVPANRRQAIMTAEFLDRILSAVWPGNIRELRNHLQQYLIFDEPGQNANNVSADSRGMDDSPARGQGVYEQRARNDQSSEVAPSGTAANPPAASIAVDATLPLSEARQSVLAHFEKIYVEQLLRAHAGKVSRAATAADVNRAYLYRLMQRHRIERGKG